MSGQDVVPDEPLGSEMAQALITVDPNKREVLAEEIVEALGRLPGDLREVFLLAHYGSIPLKEVARNKGLKESDLDSMISRANRAFFGTLKRFRPNSF